MKSFDIDDSLTRRRASIRVYKLHTNDTRRFSLINEIPGSIYILYYARIRVMAVMSSC